jgi:hypothetical protein
MVTVWGNVRSEIQKMSPEEHKCHRGEKNVAGAGRENVTGLRNENVTGLKDENVTGLRRMSPGFRFH